VASARAKRYAKAVFELAQEEGKVDEWAGRLEGVRTLLTDQEAAAVLFNPVIPSVQRLEVTDDLAAQLGKEAANLAKMMVVAGRPDLIGGIVEEYTALADEAAGRVRATATTAVALEESDQQRLSKELSQRLGKEVRLEVRVDPSIIGGMVLQIGDHLIDASVATRLQQLRRRLATA
jgi:F-type H+-transporting ATPase subunit delta